MGINELLNSWNILEWTIITKEKNSVYLSVAVILCHYLPFILNEIKLYGI